MSFIDVQQINTLVKTNDDYKNMVELMKTEVLSFGENFKDDPTWISSWGHNYFCKDDGSALTYNPKDSMHHECPLCKKVYIDQLFHQVWVYKYRNEAILTTYKAALLYKLTKEQQYMDVYKKIASFYMKNYEKFELHDKSENVFDSLETMGWGCGRLMPQGLNESISMNRFFAGTTIIKDDLDDEFLGDLDVFISQVYALLKPQVDKIHNISCWVNSAIGIMGLFSGNQEMIDFVFEGELNIRRQLREGVTKDRFWYEGSIHYNFFTLEGISYLALFAKQFNYEFGEELEIVKEMYVAAYKYAFSNHRLPNPNDGWPDVNLKTYTFIYAVGTKVFGYDSEVGHILASIINKDVERGQVPLSKPYYYNNSISLERFIYTPDFDSSNKSAPKKTSINFETSNFALLANEKLNLFYKYGHNTPSHAHPDKMTIEVMIGDQVMTRDLSNAGYGSSICNEWHRMSSSHNTIVVDGLNHTSIEPGIIESFDDSTVKATAKDVYEGIDFKRDIILREDGFSDQFLITSDLEHTYDYFMHIEGDFAGEFDAEPVDLGFTSNGYQHIKEVRKVRGNNKDLLEWIVNDHKVIAEISGDDMEVFIAKSPDNPISGWRSTLIVRKKGINIEYKVNWTIKDL